MAWRRFDLQPGRARAPVLALVLAPVLALLLSSASGRVLAQTGAYTLDITHSFVTFEVLHAGISTTRGRFDRPQGSIALDRGARSASIEMQIAIGSLRTGVPALDTLLMGADYFDVATHPSARWVADSQGFDGDMLKQLTGTLSLRGKTLPLTLTATRFNCYLNPLFRREVCGGDFEAQLKRSAWGIGPPSSWMADEVKLLIQVEAIKQ